MIYGSHDMETFDVLSYKARKNRKKAFWGYFRLSKGYTYLEHP